MLSNVHNPLNLHLGRGKLWFDRLDPNTLASSGLEFAGLVDSFTLATDEDEIRQYDYTLAQTPLSARDGLHRSPKFSATMKEFKESVLAMAMYGSVSEILQTGGAVTGEILSTSPKDGKAYQTAKRGITLATVKRGTTTLVAGTDYIIEDAESGLIYIVSGSATFLGATGNLTIDYTAATFNTAGAGRPLIIGADSTIFAKLKYIETPKRGPAYEIDIWKAMVTVDGDTEFISDQYGTAKLKFEAFSDSANHPTAPIYQAIRRP